MYKKAYALLSIGSFLLLPGCLDKLPCCTGTSNSSKPEVETAPTNIEAETPTPVKNEAPAEIMPKPIDQTPGLASQSTVLNLSSSQQLSELTSQGYVVVDFYGPNCGPCKSVSPIIDTLAQQYAGKIVFVKVNVDKFSDLSSKFNIKGVPTFYFFKDGTQVDSFSGARNKQAFEQKIKSHFNI